MFPDRGPSQNQICTMNAGFPGLAQFNYYLPIRGCETIRSSNRRPLVVLAEERTSLQVSSPPSFEPAAALSREDAYQWMQGTDDDLPELLRAARAARDRFKPGRITHSRKVFIPLTNLCRDYC